MTLPPDWTCPIGSQDQCHLEYCYTETAPNGNGLLTGCPWAHQWSTFTLIAVVSPEQVTGDQQIVQFGCVLVDFTLQQGSTSPFTSLVGTVTDAYGSAATGGIWEEYGPNACTYDPQSNTGVLIVRRLVDSRLTDPPASTSYSLIETGVMP
ncbi:MAG TPA: hypothetical protein VMG35_22290 [Bryobacteraceae bacterium]|nr:hypothetical protein [Bryobacteraceae bacterium]